MDWIKALGQSPYFCKRNAGRCKRICDSETLRFQQGATAFNERLTTGSISISCKQQNSTDFNKLWNLVRDQRAYQEAVL